MGTPPPPGGGAQDSRAARAALRLARREGLSGRPLYGRGFDDGRGAARAASHRLPRRAREPRRLSGPLRRPPGVPARAGGPARGFREAPARSGLPPPVLLPDPPVTQTPDRASHGGGPHGVPPTDLHVRNTNPP